MAKADPSELLSDQAPTGAPRFERYVIQKLEQAKLIADPLRLRVLRAFAPQPRTTKQVAELLDEKPSRLYPHVDALLAAGLLEQKGMRQKRGAIEKYLQTIAYRFEVDSELFLDDQSKADCSEQEKLVISILDSTRDELYRSVRHVDDLEHELKPLLMRFQARCTPDEIKAFRQQFLDLLKQFESKSKGKKRKNTLEYSGVFMFYPYYDED